MRIVLLKSSAYRAFSKFDREYDTLRKSPIAWTAAALFLASPALAEEIVVTGKPLSQTAADLAACLARQCPPDQDVAATLAHAENQFVAGDYKGSRSTLKKSLSRNRQHGGAYPVPVSDLLRANSRIAEHVGEVKDYQLSVLDMRDTLKSAFGSASFRTLMAQIEVGDSRTKLGFPDEAERIYGEIEKKALAQNLNRVATLARLRQALLLQVRQEDSPDSGRRHKLEALLDKVSLEPLKGAEDFAMVAEVMRARLDRSGGEAKTTQALIRRFAESGGTSRPVLLHAEPVSRIDLTKDGEEGPQSVAAWRRYTTNGQGSWADVGFWIGADGKVSDVEVLRATGESSWLKPVRKSIARRIYAPLKKGDEAPPGFYMIERYTLTARFSDDVTGSHLRMREATPRVEMIDLTPDNIPQPPRKG